MEKLTNKKFWDSVHKPEVLETKYHAFKKNLKILVKRLFGINLSEYIYSYADYLLWDVIYNNYIPKKEGAKVLEVGSAPGHHLVKLSQSFGFVPYGIDYSETGVELNRKIFILNNINQDNIIHADFLSDWFHKRYRENFDIVISRGFIEHFNNVEDIIEKHINLLKKGGYLIIIIPNLRKINYIFTWILNRELISKHNLEIMEKGNFTKLFDKEQVLTLFSDYYGTFDFGLFGAGEDCLMRFVVGFCRRFQLILNVVFRFLFKDKGAESRFFSPYLIFIGVKKE